MIPPGAAPTWAVRVLMLFGASIVLPAASGLVATTPLGRFTAVGLVLDLMGLVLLRFWWLLHPALTGPAREMQIIGAVLTLVTIALFEASLVLYLGRYPDDPLRDFVPSLALAGAACLSLVGRVAVGVRRRRLLRGPADARQGSW